MTDKAKKRILITPIIFLNYTAGPLIPSLFAEYGKTLTNWP